MPHGQRPHCWHELTTGTLRRFRLPNMRRRQPAILVDRWVRVCCQCRREEDYLQEIIGAPVMAMGLL